MCKMKIPTYDEKKLILLKTIFLNKINRLIFKHVTSTFVIIAREKKKKFSCSKTLFFKWLNSYKSKTAYYKLFLYCKECL